ncbi:MAG: PAS domain S-box protein [Ginsengibacter sp.]
MVNSKNSGFDLFEFFERTPDLVCIASKEGYFKKVNPAVIEKLGYTEEELFAKPIASFIYHEDKYATQKTRDAMLGGEALKNFENRYITKQGEIIWLEWTSIYFPEDEVVFAIAKDASKRKKAENETAENFKKAKGLASHFKSSIEKDRKYFAYELHEELAQLAAVVKLDLNHRFRWRRVKWFYSIFKQRAKTAGSSYYVTSRHLQKLCGEES